MSESVAQLRNASQHEYWTLTAEDIHVAVTRQRRELPSFVAAVGMWVETLLGDRDVAE